MRRRQVPRNSRSFLGKLLFGLRRQYIFWDAWCYLKHHVRVLSVEFYLSEWKQSVDQLPVRRGVHGTRRRDVYCLCSGKVQDIHGL